ncbi:MAG: alpha/beta hydrolase [Myxococcales bacterium]|nr:alpha/beta hydrolase [Myxococcales bacterium]
MAFPPHRSSQTPLRSPARLMTLATYILGSWLLLGCNMIKLHQDHVVNSLRSEGIQSHTISLTSGKMRYFSGGNGFPIVFIHGFGGNASQTWRTQMVHFSKSYRVFAPDIYWFGESQPNNKQVVGTPADQADAIAELLDRHGIAKAHVVGVSFGGYISLAFAIRHPQKVERLVAVDSAGIEPTTAEREKMMKAFAYAKGSLADLLIPKSTQDLEKFLSKVFYKPHPIPGFALEPTLKQIFWKNKEQREQIALFLTGNFIKAEQLKGIQKPTAVFWGQHDPLLLPSMGQRLAQSIPKAQFRIFKESGHMPMLEENKLFNAALSNFLQSPPLSATASR